MKNYVMKNALFMLLGAAITLLILVVGREIINPLMFSTAQSASESSANAMSEKNDEPEVLYWVAPMDANFRRDKPGKSTMGMDLIPVYATGKSAGVVEISATVGNNIGIKTAEVRWMNPEINFLSSGQVEYAQENVLHIHARASGWIEELYVKDIGQKVEKGQPLYGLYSLELIDAQEDYLRALNVKNTRLMSAAKNRLKSLRVDDKVLQKLKRDKKVDQVTLFYAPQSGYIEKLTINQGMYVSPENTLLSIAKADTVLVNVEVNHQQAAWLSQFPGQIQWNLTSDLMPTKTWQATLDYIRPELNQALRTLSIRLLVENNDQLLKPNMWLTLKGDIKGRDKTLIIPSQALIRTQQETRVVMALGEGQFKSVAVTAGRFFNQQVEIVQGLQAGDRIVTRAQFLIDSESNIDSDLQRIDVDLSGAEQMDMSSMSEVTEDDQ